MAKRSIQGFVEVASGLGELTRSRAKEAAADLLTLTGVEGSSKKVAKQASKLADDLLVAAETNRKQVVRLVRTEVEAALGKVDVGRLVSEVQGLGATVAALAAQVDDLARSAAGRPSASRSTVADVEPEPARVAPRPAAASVPATKAPAKKAPAKEAATTPPAKKAAKKAPAKKAPAKKVATTAPAKKAAKKAPARKAPAKEAASTAATKAPGKKASTTKASTTKAAPAKKASAKKASAKKASAKKTSATKPTTGGTTA